VARGVAGLGALALFGSLIGDWATTSITQEESFTEYYVTGVGSSNWGVGWMIGVLAISATVALSLLGPVNLRVASRVAGLSVAGAMLALLISASVDLDRRGPFPGVLNVTEYEVETTFGQGWYAGYLALALLGAAMWLAPLASGSSTTEPSAGNPDGHRELAGPGDLTVGPAEPLAFPDDKHEWR
jgi:hypothetical protein